MQVYQLPITLPRLIMIWQCSRAASLDYDQLVWNAGMAYLGLVEAEVLGPRDGRLGRRRQVLPRAPAPLDLRVDALEHLGAGTLTPYKLHGNRISN